MHDSIRQQQQQQRQAKSPPSSSLTTTEEEDRVPPFVDGVLDPFAHLAPYAPAAVRHHPERHVVFAIPPASLDTPVDDVLECPTLRHLPQLSPRTNPLLTLLEQGCVSDGDRVALNVISYGRATSASRAAAEAAAEGAALGADAEAMEAVTAAALASHAPTEASEEAGQNLLHSKHGQYVQLPPLPGQPRGSSRVVIPLPALAMRAGVRDTIYFDPAQVNAAVVTTGSICPGTNDVVSALVQRLGMYGVPDGKILGIRYGFEGFTAHGSKPMTLSPRRLDSLHLTGGSVLGSSSPLTSATEASRQQKMREVAQKLREWDINMLFVVGGEGGNTLGADVARSCALSEVPCVVVGVPKSIDNDFLLLDKSFGFDTAVEQAQLPLLAAKTEASSALRGIGLVKLFGRRSGFLTLQTSLASGVVDACLIPEVSIDLPLLLDHLGRLLEDRGHVVVCVAEGAGQDLLFEDGEPRPCDEAGNPILRDIGAFLKKVFKSGALGEVDVKYIDPTHLVEATAPSATDHVLAKTMGQHAADAAMAGFTGVMCGVVNGHHCLLPSHIVTQSYRSVHPFGKAYNRLRASTGQPF